MNLIQRPFINHTTSLNLILRFNCLIPSPKMTRTIGNRYHNDQSDYYQVSGPTDCIQQWYPGEKYRDSFGIAV